MPPRDKLYHCYCLVCCEVDQSGTAGNSTGKLQLVRHKAIHLRETTSLDPSSHVPWAVVESLASSAISQQGNSDIDSLSAVLFASSLCDDGLDLDSQPHKLWASHKEFQRVASTDIGDVGVPNISDLVDAVGRISIGDSLFSGGVLSLNTCSNGLQSRDIEIPSGREFEAHRVLDSIEAPILVVQQKTLEMVSVDAHTACSQVGGEKQLGRDVTADERDSNMEAVTYDSFLS
ncbi:hypothetical protein EV401DRAFT_1889329 [Pisolithus croceorrhizus]|nr:hypothetical protein EV401DRAFT_1889329 [Pisolithus croceorrhizus]